MLTTAMAPAAILRVARRPACRMSSVLGPFISNFAPSSARVSVATSRSQFLAPTAVAAFSTFRPTPSRLHSPSIIEQRIEEEQSNDKQESNAEASSGSGGSDEPWYLQVEPPRHPTLVHPPSLLPDIPEGSPKLMEPLLKFASSGLGMDDLALLDLRELDPPAAIGPNLMMVFGTSRSERHLHVSADRMVRWLRRRAGIMAKADGLIGRNELKVKLRRLERKARLLGNSGAMRGGDDGISTGWVCVNLGVVGGSTQEVETFDAEGRSTGFGVPQTGTTIIIQMLTEGRRKDLDLEGLWNGMLQRSLEKAQGLPVGARSTNPFEW